MTEDADEQSIESSKPVHNEHTQNVPKTIVLPEIEEPDQAVADESFRKQLRDLKKWCLKNKKLSFPGIGVGLLIILAAIPFTRYALAGTVLKQNYTVEVLEDVSKKPVTNATITIGSVHAETDNQGKATVHVKVGSHTIQVTKKYYKDYSASITVPITKQQGTYIASVTATGRQIPVKVVNTITGKAVENIAITVAGTVARTDKNGLATVVVGADTATLTGTMSGSGYNDTKITVTLNEQPLSTVTVHKITPSGKVYFLSKLSGKIDVVKTNLDGSARQTVVAGTGSEEDGGTVLLASRDWKYLAFLSRRDSTLAKLYLIDTATDTMSVMDEGNASFTLSGWSNSYFVYKVDRKDVAAKAPKEFALKSFDAATKQLTTIDESAEENNGPGYLITSFDGVYILNDRIVYYTPIYTGVYFPAYTAVGLKVSIVSVKNDGTDKKVLKSLDAGTLINGYLSLGYMLSSLENPNTVNYTYDTGSTNGTKQYFTFKNGTLSDATEDETSKPYPTYLASPSGKATLWYEPRDGKNTLLLGDPSGANGAVVQDLTEYSTYGWYSEDYLLVSKNGSELFILPAQANVPTDQVIKISDYHKPTQSYYGYGGGYGGL